MFSYILKRIGYILFVAFIISIILFFIHKMIPGDPVKHFIDRELIIKDPAAYKEQYDRLKAQLGLNDPVYIQYFKWLINALKGNLGYTNDGQLVTEYIKEPLKNTVFLNIFVLILVFLISVPLGIFSAIKRFTTFDSSVQVVTIIGISIPTFFIGLISIFLFSVRLGWLPTGGMQPIGYTGEGWDLFVTRLPYIVLPVLVLTFSSLAGITRYIRGAMIDVLTKDYIRTARSKGLSGRVIVLSHAFKNALIPVITIMTGWLIGVFGGSTITETIFRYEGIGYRLFQALRTSDYMVVMAMNMFYTILALVGNLLMDLGYMLVDPRIKLT